MKGVLIVGPAGCGKTLHAEALRQHFGCATVHDNWRPVHGVVPGALMLTQSVPADPLPYLSPELEAYEFADAMRRMNDSHASLLS